jgi:hypothetical protein
MTVHPETFLDLRSNHFGSVLETKSALESKKTRPSRRANPEPRTPNLNVNTA